jgi:hypothetical protein
VFFPGGKATKAWWPPPFSAMFKNEWSLLYAFWCEQGQLYPYEIKKGEGVCHLILLSMVMLTYSCLWHLYMCLMLSPNL